MPKELLRLSQVKGAVQLQNDVAAMKSTSTYTHDQLIAESVWTVTHNLNKFPSVSVVDSSNSLVIGDVQYIDLNTVTITFSSPFGGKVHFN